MELSLSLALWTLLVLLPILLLLHGRTTKTRPLPPGPRGWPIIGNMFDLGPTPHRDLASLSTKYGPLLWLRLGCQKILVIQTAKAAEELFKHHDLSFADRNINETMRVHDFDKGSMILSPYGTYWRFMKKLCTIEMMVNKRISETANVREKCVGDMIRWIEDAGLNSEAEPCTIEVARFVFLAVFNLLGNFMLSRDLVDPSSQDGSEFFAAMTRLTQWTGIPNLADFFPWLRCLDLQGLRRKTERDMKKALDIASSYVKERIQEKETGADLRDRKDFLDVLLEKLEGDGAEDLQKLSEHQIQIFISEFFMAGTESTSSTIEFALTELLANPDAMSKVKEELHRVVGPQRKFRESDTDNLPYLQALIKETLRLHPPTPFLVPRRAVEDVKFMGYDIPLGTQVWVNACAIGIDPACWDDPFMFKPERFIGSSTDYKGQNYELIPFGAGRRMCVGVTLAHRMLLLTMGSLLHNFDWELESHLTPETLDMKDRIGLTARKLVPLKAIPRKCHVRMRKLSEGINIK